MTTTDNINPNSENNNNTSDYTNHSVMNISIVPSYGSNVTFHTTFAFNIGQQSDNRRNIDSDIIRREEIITEYRIENNDTDTNINTNTDTNTNTNTNTNNVVVDTNTYENRNENVNENSVNNNNLPSTNNSSTGIQQIPVTETNVPLPPGLFGNRRINLTGPNNNPHGTFELFSYAPQMNSNTPVNTTAFANQINNMTRNLVDLFSGNRTVSTTNQQTSFSQTGGLSLSDIRQHTTLTIYRNNGTTDDQSPTINCEVCHDNINDGDILRVINGCSHSFHQECIDSWLEGNRICPYCRGNIIVNTPPEEIHLNTETESTTDNTENNTNNNNDNT